MDTGDGLSGGFIHGEPDHFVAGTLAADEFEGAFIDELQVLLAIGDAGCDNVGAVRDIQRDGANLFFATELDGDCLLQDGFADELTEALVLFVILSGKEALDAGEPRLIKQIFENGVLPGDVSQPFQIDGLDGEDDFFRVSYAKGYFPITVVVCNKCCVGHVQFRADGAEVFRAHFGGISFHVVLEFSPLFLGEDEPTAGKFDGRVKVQARDVVGAQEGHCFYGYQGGILLFAQGEEDRTVLAFRWQGDATPVIFFHSSRW